MVILKLRDIEALTRIAPGDFTARAKVTNRLLLKIALVADYPVLGMSLVSTRLAAQCTITHMDLGTPLRPESGDP